MPRMPEGLGPETGLQARCTACGKVTLVHVDRTQLLLSVVEHYEDDHRVDTTVMLEGEGGQFVIERLPLARCDLCGVPAELPWWVCVTPRSPDYEVEDPEWCVCDGCHPLVAAHDVVGLCRRIWEVSDEYFVIRDRVKMKDGIRYTVTNFLSHLQPESTYRQTT